MGNHVNAEDRSQAGAALTGVDRVLACLILLAGESNGTGLDEVAKELSSPKSSTHRALASLVRAGLVEQDEDRRYRLSFNFVRLAFSYYEGLDRRQLLQPILDELAEMFGETVHYGELEGVEVVYLGQARPRGERVQMTARIGGRNPAYCTGLGKALLSYVLPDGESVTEFVKLYGPLAKRTPKTLTSASALNDEFRATRERGYAVDREESDPGITCISFPIFIGRARPTGAISISALANRTPLEALLDRADDIRRVIEAHLGEMAVPAPAFA
jgi:IclR family transcriptional regulator, acetate operon repressor